MFKTEASELARRANEIYELRLRSKLMPAHADDFVAIDPQSGDYFLGKTMSAAIQAARAAYPDRIPYTLRIGHPATVELGVVLS